MQALLSHVSVTTAFNLNLRFLVRDLRTLILDSIVHCHSLRVMLAALPRSNATKATNEVIRLLLEELGGTLTEHGPCIPARTI